MKKNVFKIIFCVLGICTVIINPSFSKDIVRLTVGEWPPFVSKDLKYKGLVSRIVTEAFALENISVEYGFFPWKRSLELARLGEEWDGSAVWTVDEKRKQFFITSDPVIMRKIVFFHLKSAQFDWNDIEDLKNISIGATIGYHYGEKFQRAEKEGVISVQRIPTDELNFTKLLKDRIHVFVCNITSGYSILNKVYAPETAALFTNHPKTLIENPLALILSNQNHLNESRMKKFNLGLRQIKENGSYDLFVEESRKGKYKKE